MLNLSQICLEKENIVFAFNSCSIFVSHRAQDLIWCRMNRECAKPASFFSFLFILLWFFGSTFWLIWNLLGTWWHRLQLRRCFSCAEKMISPAVWYIFALTEIAVINTESNVSLSKGYSLSFPSMSTKFGRRLVNRFPIIIKKNGKKFVEVCLLTQCANKPPLIILRQLHRDSHQEPSYSVVHNAHLIENHTPKLCNAQYRSCCVKLHSSLSNSLPWSLMRIFIHQCLHLTSWRNWEMVEALLSLMDFISDYLLK